jgi:hypothetical protein
MERLGFSCSLLGKTLALGITNEGQSYTNTGLANGTLNCYVVSATNATAESMSSIQVSGRPVSTAVPTMTITNSSVFFRLVHP